MTRAGLKLTKAVPFFRSPHQATGRILSVGRTVEEVLTEKSRGKPPAYLADFGKWWRRFEHRHPADKRKSDQRQPWPHPSATSPFRAEKGTLRVITLAPSLEYLVAKSLDELRLSAARNVTVLRQVLLVTPRARGTVHARLGSRRNWRPFDRWILRPPPGSMRNWCSAVPAARAPRNSCEVQDKRRRGRSDGSGTGSEIRVYDTLTKPLRIKVEVEKI